MKICLATLGSVLTFPPWLLQVGGDVAPEPGGFHPPALGQRAPGPPAPLPRAARVLPQEDPRLRPGARGAHEEAGEVQANLR